MTLPEALPFIHQNQVWAIVGDAGSGHSALVNSIHGTNVENVSLKHNFKTLSNTRDFYYQQRFNSSDSEDALTVEQYLTANAVSDGRWTIDKVIDIFHLDKLLPEQVIKLSNGETKRLLLASALLKNPGVITLDHPLTGLDSHARNEFNNMLTAVMNSGISIVMATNPFEIPSSVTHVAVMSNGNIAATTTKADFQPAHYSFQHVLSLDTTALHQLVSSQPSSAFSAIIEMNHVCIEYDGRKILDNINWLVKQGERWALTGPNGAGKSTLLSLVNGDNPQAYANDITLFDRKRGSGESIWDIKRQTGFVSPELYQYFPTDSSCLHVIESGFYDTVGLFRPTDPDKEMICNRWMELMHIHQYANRLFSMVPPGAQRLCLLARAMVKNPTLLILDEPTQGLDHSQQQFFTMLVDEICHRTNVTLIYVSHYEHHIPKAVTRRIQLEQGKII